MRRQPPWTSWWLTLAAAVAGLAGCAGTQPANPPAAPITPITSSASGATVVDLATRSGRWPATQELLEAAINRLNRECLTARGFDPPEAPRPRYPVPEDEATIIDLPARRARGYGLAPGDPGGTTGQGAAAGRDSYHDGLSPAEQRRYHRALFGPAGKATRVKLGTTGGYALVNQDGCEAASRRALAGDVVAWARLTYLPQSVDNRLALQALTAPGRLAALAGWKSCMARRGYDVDTPDDARAAAEAAYRGPGSRSDARRREIAVAVADGECAAAVHLPTAELTARRGLVAGLPEADRRMLADLAALRDATLTRAVAALSS